MQSWFFSPWPELIASPVLWITVTLAVYLAAFRIYGHFNNHPLLLPVLIAVVVVVGILTLTGTPYAQYEQATQFLHFLIGPATVALAVPLYTQLPRLKQMWKPISVALLVGCLTAILSALGIAWLFGATTDMLLSLAPKSATMPIAMEVAGLTGGIASLTTVACAITGISGAILTGPLLQLMKITDPVAHGFAMGLSAHAIGTGRAFQVDETTGAFSALGLSLNGVATAILVPFVLAALGLFTF
jgi:predicted murein hydrolase (TIGR00659 family)